MPPHYYPRNQKRRPHSSRIPAEIAQLEAATAEAEKENEFNGQEENRPVVHLSGFRAKSVADLVKMAEDIGVANAGRQRKQDLIFTLLKERAHQGDRIHGKGTLEVLPDHYGFLRYSEQSYVAGPGDIYVSQNQIRRFNLSTGDVIAGAVRTPRDNERYFALIKADTINDVDAQASRDRRLFENLTPLFPTEQLTLERNIRAEENITGRIIDIISPIGKGQRGLLVASPKSGKTVILQHIANAIEENHPDVVLIVLLIDERPKRLRK